MSLASKLSRFVDSRIRSRGRDYYRQGLVELHSREADEVEATVSGSNVYSVLLQRMPKTVRASCSCPFFDDGEICKHIWAVLLAVDAEGGLRGRDGGLPDRLLADWEDDLDGEPFALEMPEPPRPPPASPAARNAQSPQHPAWQEVLNQIERTQATALPSADEISYVIDAPATLARQQLTVQILTGRRKRDGSFGRLYHFRGLRSEIAHWPDPADREILGLLAGAAPSTSWGSWYPATAAIVSPCEAPESVAGSLVPLLCATGRCRVISKPQKDPEPLAWDGGTPWELWLAVREAAAETFELTGRLRRGEESLALAELDVILQSGLLFAYGRAARFTGPGAFAWMAALRRTGPLRIPAAEREALLERLLATQALSRLDLPESMGIEEVRSAFGPLLRLRPPPGGGQTPDWPRAELFFVYAHREVPAGVPGRGLFEREERRFLLRDLDGERRAAGRLPELGFRPPAYNPAEPYRIPAGRIPEAVRTLLAEGWSVEAEGKLFRAASRFKVRVSSGVDWFELHGEAEYGGEAVSLPELLAAVRRGHKYMTLSDGSLGLLPEEWLKKVAPVAGLGKPEGDHLKYQAAQACLLDAWLASEPEATWDETFAGARRRLQEFHGLTPADAAPGFCGELRGYQRAGLGWLGYLRDFGFGGCLADDMGLGKTIQVLALLESRRELPGETGPPLGPSLVVVPRSLVFNWLAEAARFTPGLRVLDHTGAGRSRGDQAFTAWDLVLTTYGTLRRDVADLRQVEFDYVILDEAQAIKNADSQTAKAARLLRGRHRLALTGTPIENHLGELWSLLEFLNPGVTGASSVLGATTDLRDPDPGTRELLARAVRPFLLRRTKEQVAPELPAKTEQTLFCELPPKQRSLYDELRRHYRESLGKRIDAGGLGRTKILVLEALLRLRQAACHPGLIDRGRADEPSAKLDLLVPQLREVIAEGHKALVFSQFTSFLGLLRRQLDREGLPHLYLDGRTRDRRERVEQFQSDAGFPLFLISLKAGGLGLNLTAADYVYLLDPWWNPTAEAQAVDRAHRIGQMRPVFACRIVARDTVEEKILELQKAKRALADAIIQADQSLLAHLSREDLDLLLS